MKKIKLGELIDVTRGMSLPGDKYAESGDLIRLTLGNFNIQGNGFKPNTSKTDLYYTGSVKKEFIMKKGDIITPLTEQTYGLLGSTARIPESGKYIQSQDVALIRSKSDKLYEDFCYYLISSPFVRKQLGAAAQQTKIRHTSPDKIKDCEVIIPEDVNQQIKITNLLNTIENKIALNNKTNTELENMAKTIYDYWFTQFDFPDKNGHPYKTSGGQMVYNETLKREIPAGWEVGKLCDIANITMGQSPDGESYNEDGNGTIFYQGSTDFGNRSPSIRVYTTAPTRFAKKNDILMSVRAPVGTLNIANTDCCIGRGLAALNSKSNSISYLYCVMRNFQRQFEVLDSIGTTFGSITKDDLFGLQVIIPPKKIIEDFGKIGNEIFKEQSRIDEENTELIKLRDYLLPLLMNGQIEVK